MTKELLQQALEVLLMNPAAPDYSAVRGKAIAALHTAIAQPVQPSLSDAQFRAMCEQQASASIADWSRPASQYGNPDMQAMILEKLTAQPSVSDAALPVASPEPVAYRYRLKGDLQWQHTESSQQAAPPCEVQKLYTQGAPVQPSMSDTDRALERYMAANYPDAQGATLAERVIDALEKMDIDLGMREIAQPAVSDAALPVVSPELTKMMTPYITQDHFHRAFPDVLALPQGAPASPTTTKAS